MKNKIIYLIFIFSLLLIGCNNNESTFIHMLCEICEKCVGCGMEDEDVCLGHEEVHTHLECEECGLCIASNCLGSEYEKCFGHKYIVDHLELELSDDRTYYKIIDYYDKNSKSLAIPNYYNNIVIKVIDEKAFSECYNLETIFVPETIEFIKEEAFLNCNSLKQISIPNSIKRIENDAFKGCDNLIYYKNNDILYLGNEENNYLVVAKLSDPIGKFTYNLNTKMILADVFKDVQYKDVYFPGTISEYCNIIFINEFSNPMSTCENFYIINSSYEITDQLEKVIIPGNIKKINDYQFYGFSMIKEVVIESGVEEIGTKAFDKCDNIEKCYVPDTIKIIKNNSIYNTKLYCESKIKLGTWELSYNNNVQIILGTSLYADNFIYELSENKTYYIIKGIKEIVNEEIIIPQIFNNIPVIEIGENAFSNIINVDKIIIPKTIVKFQKNAFVNFPVNVSTYYKGTMVDWLRITFENIDSNPVQHNSKFYMFDENEQYYDLNQKVIIPDGVSTLKNYSFSKYNYIDIYIPGSLKKIGNYAFYKKYYLRNVYYGGTVKEYCGLYFETLDANPMKYASNFYLLNRDTNEYEPVISLEIPEGIHTISDYKFYKFKDLTSITIPSTLTYIEKESFYQCDKLKNIYYNGTVENLCLINWLYIDFNNHYDSFFRDSFEHFYMLDKNNLYYEVKELIIPNTIDEIYPYLFKNFKSLERVEISNSLLKLPNGLFQNCDNLKEVIIPSSIMEISYGVFENCDNLENIYYNGTIEDWMNLTIRPSGNPMLYLDNIYMLDEKGDYYLVERIEIPENITKIDGHIGFSNLKELVIHNNVTSIDDLCPMENLETVYYNGSPEEWINIKIWNEIDNPFYYADKFYFLNENNEYYETKTIELPEDMTTIYSYTDLYGFTDIIIHSKLEYIYSSSMMTLKNVYYKGTIEQWFKIYFDFFKKNNPMYYAEHFYMLNENNEYYEIEEIHIPETVRILDDQLVGFKNVKKIYIPATVKEIRGGAFDLCYNATLYCEIAEFPKQFTGEFYISLWSTYWNPLDLPVVWDYLNQDTV